VPRALFANAITWRSGAWQLAAVLGPALGGLIYGFGNATAAYVVDVVLMLAALSWRARKGPRLFAATLAELGKDGEALGGRR